MIIALQLILVFCIAGSAVYYAWCAMSTIQFFRATKQNIGANCQPVSVLIPVCGVDEGARENWESFCQQDYDRYEVIFGVMNPQDPAVPILEEVVAKFRDRAKLVFCLEVRGLNYQVSNLTHLLEAAQHDWVIFTDSDMRVGSDYVRVVTAPLAESGIGAVTCGHLGHEPKFLVAALASLGRCIDYLPSVLIARTLYGGLDFALGATIATRKSILEQAGGLQSIVDRIASDYHIGNMVANAGYRVELSRYILESDSGNESLQQLFHRELRWARSIRWTEGSLYYGYACIYGTVYCVPLLLLSGFQSWAVILCPITVAIRLVQVLVSMYSMGCPKLVRWIWMLPLRDLLSFVVFVAGAFGQTVYWRGRRLSIGEDSVLTERSPL
jgi:ceramide glucosyltransferase